MRRTILLSYWLSGTNLGSDYIDVYLLHNMTPGNWEAVKKYDGFTFLDKMIEKGKIRHKGFSIHNSLKAFKEIVDSFDWEMAHIQLNILGETMQAEVEGLQYAANKGLAVVIMEPLMGGYLLNNVPAEVDALVQSHPEKRSLVEWCFRWLYNMPETSVILSGTSSMAQLKENLRIFDHAVPNVMSDEDQEFIHKIQDALRPKKVLAVQGAGTACPVPKASLFRKFSNCITAIN